MRAPASIDQRRFSKWVNASHAMDRIEPALAVFIQGLGRFDAKLIFEDARFAALPSGPTGRGSFEESLKLTDRFFESTLWVFAAYEAIRTLDERVARGGTKLVGVRLARRIKRTKRHLERIRMPLAKLQPGNRYPNDDPIAVRAMHQRLGIAWRVKKRVYVVRRDLSDMVLELFEVLERDRERRMMREGKQKLKA